MESHTIQLMSPTPRFSTQVALGIEFLEPLGGWRPTNMTQKDSPSYSRIAKRDFQTEFLHIKHDIIIVGQS